MNVKEYSRIFYHCRTSESHIDLPRFGDTHFHVHNTSNHGKPGYVLHFLQGNLQYNLTSILWLIMIIWLRTRWFGRWKLEHKNYEIIFIGQKRQNAVKQIHVQLKTIGVRILCERFLKIIVCRCTVLVSVFRLNKACKEIGQEAADELQVP